jgi:hypothetical protein
MPRATRRLARASKLVRAYIQHQKAHKNRLACRIVFLKHHAHQENLDAPEPVSFALDDLSELSAALSELSAASPSTDYQ